MEEFLFPGNKVFKEEMYPTSEVSMQQESTTYTSLNVSDGSNPLNTPVETIVSSSDSILGKRSRKSDTSEQPPSKKSRLSSLSEKVLEKRYFLYEHIVDTVVSKLGYSLNKNNYETFIETNMGIITNSITNGTLYKKYQVAYINLTDRKICTVTYETSFGISSMEDVKRQVIKEYLARFDSITERADVVLKYQNCIKIDTPTYCEIMTGSHKIVISLIA